MKQFFLHHKKLHTWLLADLCLLAAFALLRESRGAMNAFVGHVSNPIRRFVGRLCYRVDFSVAEMLCVVLVLTVIYLAASAVIALGYSVFYFELPLPNGSVGQLLDLMDYISNSVMMPFIALLSTLLIGWVMTPDYVIDEMQRGGKTFRRKKLYRVMIRYIAPVLMLILFLQSTGILS